MSLIHALLQDPVPMDAWIVSSRADGVLGSGTESDPWSGGLRATKVVGILPANVTLSALVGTFYTITISGTSHPFLVNDFVLMSGFSLPNGELLNGTFKLTAATATSFSFQVYFEPPNTDLGLTGDLPYLSLIPGTDAPTAQLDPYLFDAVMRSLVAKGVPVTIHLGPGVFETRGYGISKDDVSWSPITGTKIRGSGIGVTTLKLVKAVGRNKAFHAIAVPPQGATFPSLDGCDTENFTVDCNIAGQPSQSLTCGAIFIRGQRTRLRRIRAINFGRQGDTHDSLECFVLAVCGADFAVPPSPPSAPSFMEEMPDCVVEECIVEQPGLNNVKETTCIVGIEGDAGLVDLAGKLPAFARATVVRNCLVNCEYQVNPVSIGSIAIDTPTTHVATVTTRGPHGLATGQWIRIDGAFLAGVADNAFNGSYQVTYLNLTQFTYVPKDGATYPASAPDTGSEMWVGRFPSHPVAIDVVGSSPAITPITTGPPTWIYQVVTKTAHYLVPGSRVAMTVNFNSGPTAHPVLPWNDAAWVVSSGAVGGQGVIDRKTFTMERSTDPGTIPSGTGNLDAFIGVSFQAVSIGGSSGVMEQNTLMNCLYGGSRRDTSSLRDLVVRYNYYRNVFGGPANLIQSESGPLRVMSSLERDPADPTIAIGTVRVGKPHGLTVGQAIRISNVPPLPTTKYNGIFTILSIDTTICNSFRYQMLGDPGVDYSGTLASPNLNLVPSTLQALWQYRDVTIESNIIELQPGRNAHIVARGVTLGVGLPQSYAPGNQFTTLHAVLRHNIVRYVVGPSGAPVGNYPADQAFSTQYCQNALLENNVVDLPGSTDPILDRYCQHVRYFNNSTPGGQLIQGKLGAPGSAANQQELTTLVDEALALSIL